MASAARQNSLELSGTRFNDLCRQLRERTAALRTVEDWPREQFGLLRDAGVLGWTIPVAYGGWEFSEDEMAAGYERLAAACLVTTFVLTQRNGACQRIAGSQNDESKSELLPALCAGEIFATVGISHLTTSRQHLGRPVVTAIASRGGYILDGTVPWVTGATQADYVVTGGTCPDGKQILAAVPTRLKGVVVGAPLKLLALDASQTGPMQLDRVEVDARFVLAGPIEAVMKQGTGGGAGSLTTSALAVGAAAGALKRLADEARARPEVAATCSSLQQQYEQIRRSLLQAAEGEIDGENGPTSEEVRMSANSLVLRAAQAYLAASKGAGFVAGHPAERAVREAMFFLVWSCPQPVLAAALEQFACAIGWEDGSGQ